MSSIEFALSNILSPAILFFALGIIAILVKSDLEIPDTIGTTISLFILTAIGLKSGIAVSQTGIYSVISAAISAVFIGVLITSLAYLIMSKIGYDSANAASIAGHYGACSSVTLTTVIVFLEQSGAPFEDFVPALYPFMDTAALVTGIFLGHAGLKRKLSGTNYSILSILRASLTGKSTILIIGGFLVGLVSGTDGTKDIMPFFDSMFKGVFTIFMLDIGLLAGSRISELKNIKLVTFLVAIALPIIQASAAILTATFIGLSPGGATIFAALAAGASYITAPAVMRSTFPEANPSLPLGMSLGIVFPFNVLVGIPLYYEIAHFVAKGA